MSAAERVRAVLAEWSSREGALDVAAYEREDFDREIGEALADVVEASRGVLCVECGTRHDYPLHYGAPLPPGFMGIGSPGVGTKPGRYEA